MPLEEQVKENKIFFNSSITVDMIKVSRNPDMSFNDFVASKNKVDAKTCLWNDFSSGVNANYFSQEEDALFVIYRKTPSQKYYDYVCTIGNGQFEFQDYKVVQRQFYHYLAIVRKNDGSYIAYENIDDNEDLRYLRTVWDNWSICDLEQDINNNKILYKTGKTWLLGLNFAQESVTQNISVLQYETLGRYNKYGLGRKNYESSNFTCLLGAMNEVYPIGETSNDNSVSKSLYTYTERDNLAERYSIETEKLIRWREFSTNGKLKLLKDIKRNMWIIQIVSTPSYEIDNKGNVLPTTISFDWEEAMNINDFTIISKQEE